MTVSAIRVMDRRQSTLSRYNEAETRVPAMLTPIRKIKLTMYRPQ